VRASVAVDRSRVATPSAVAAAASCWRAVTVAVCSCASVGLAGTARAVAVAVWMSASAWASAVARSAWLAGPAGMGRQQYLVIDAQSLHDLPHRLRSASAVDGENSRARFERPHCHMVLLGHAVSSAVSTTLLRAALHCSVARLERNCDEIDCLGESRGGPGPLPAAARGRRGEPTPHSGPAG